jgi:AcrR family transcriptional regulator
MTGIVKSGSKRRYNTALRTELAQVTRQRIIDAARRLLVRGTYSHVTIDDIAREAGVAYQTVYSVFGTKLRLAQAMLESGFHSQGTDDLISDAHESSDPEVALRIGAQITRRFNEPCADLFRFMRESGDPNLLQRYQDMATTRLSEVAFMAETLEQSGRLRASLTTSEVHDVIWGMSGPDWYIQLVFERGWTPSRYEAWLGDALINLLLQPKAAELISE